jgi:hypothetical protein
MNENEIRELLGQGIGEEPPVVGGPAAVFAGARARVVRTRAVTGALSVVAVLGVAAGAVAFGGAPGRADRSQRVVAGTTPSPAASPTPATTPTTKTPPPDTTTTPTPSSQLHGPGLTMHHAPAPVPGAGQVLMDSRSTALIAKLHLPSGLVTADYEGQDSHEPAQLGVDTIANMSVDDGTGKPVLLNVHLVQNSEATDRITDCTTVQYLNSGRISDCRTETEPDGSVVLSYSVRADASGKSSVTQSLRTNEAARVFPDGSVVSIDASNFYSPVNGPLGSPSRSIPLISIDELTAMVMDSRWGLTVPAQFAQQAKQDLVPYMDNTQH